MHADTFDKILEYRIKRMRNVLASKAEEYASDGDRLHNFKAAAAMSGPEATPETASWGMNAKHLVSVLDMVLATRDGGEPTVPHLQEKIGDAINYLVLLEAMFVERIGVMSVAVAQGYPALAGDSKWTMGDEDVTQI